MQRSVLFHFNPVYRDSFISTISQRELDDILIAEFQSRVSGFFYFYMSGNELLIEAHTVVDFNPVYRDSFISTNRSIYGILTVGWSS